MGTISRNIAKDVINGKYPTDRTAKIVTYNNMFDGGLTFATVYEREDFLRYERSGACSNVQTVWLSTSGLTAYGKEILGV